MENNESKSEETMVIAKIGEDFTFYDISKSNELDTLTKFGEHPVEDLVFNRKSVGNLLNGRNRMSNHAVQTVFASIMQRWQETLRREPRESSTVFYDTPMFQPVGMVWDGEQLVILHYAPGMNDLIKN